MLMRAVYNGNNHMQRSNLSHICMTKTWFKKILIDTRKLLLKKDKQLPDEQIDLTLYVTREKGASW